MDHAAPTSALSTTIPPPSHIFPRTPSLPSFSPTRQRGPYTYKKHSEKFDIEWHNGGEYVSFYTHTMYSWDASRAPPGIDPATETLSSPYVVAVALKTLVVDNLELVSDVLAKVRCASQADSGPSLVPGDTPDPIC